jgi:hypothetical protein
MSLTITGIPPRLLKEKDLVLVSETYKLMTTAQIVMDRGYSEEFAWEIALQVRDIQLKEDNMDSDMNLIDKILKERNYSGIS